MDKVFLAATDLGTWLAKGGLVMVPLLLCSILGLAIILAKLLQLRQRKIIRPTIVNLLHSIDSPDDIDVVLRVCQDQQGPFANIIVAGLQNRDLSPDGIREILEDKGRQESRTLEHGLVALDTIAVIAPLLGLLGTVLGMVDVFNELASADQIHASQLSGGISKALITTVVGLCVGIPALVAHNYLLSKVEELSFGIEENLNLLFLKLRRFAETRMPSKHGHDEEA